MSKDVIAMEGEVHEVLPNTLFRVKITDTHIVLATLSGKMRLHRIRILNGDRVQIELSPYDLTRGRIVRRLDKKFENPTEHNR